MDNSREEGICPEVIWDGRELDWVDPGNERLYLRGVGRKYLADWPFSEAHKLLLKKYKPKKKYKLGLFIPCAYGKPYSQSYIHYLLRKSISEFITTGELHEIILTNAGVVPRELDEYWPYVAYDWNPLKETDEIKECYTAVLADRIIDYITTFRDYYERFLAYLRWDSDSWKALLIASEKLGINIENTSLKEVPEDELREADLGLGYSEDPDLVLVTKSNLDRLRTRIRDMLNSS